MNNLKPIMKEKVMDDKPGLLKKKPKFGQVTKAPANLYARLTGK
jgi:hypothetical protein